MTFNEAELAALASDMQNIGIFVRFDVLADPVRIWLGFGDIRPGVNVFDPDGALYKGLGKLRSVPNVKQLLNGSAERVEFVLSGISSDLLAIAFSEADLMRNRPATLGFAIMDTTWALLGPVRWCAYYVADVPTIAQGIADDKSSITRTISLSCGSRFTGRRRPSFAYFSDQDQQARFPGDLFCSLTPNYAHGYDKNWPVFS